MKNRSVYLVKRKGALIVVYSNGAGSICCKEHLNGSFTNEEVITNNKNSKFSLNITATGELFLFCRDYDGGLHLFNCSGKKWTGKLIQSNISHGNIHFNAVIDSSEIHLLYNAPAKHGYDLLYQKMTSGKWSDTGIAANELSDSNPPFTVQNISKNHYVVYFQTTEKESALCYKEFYLPDKWGALNILNKTNYSYADTSVLTTKSGIYISFVIRGAYSCRLIFVGKTGDKPSPPIVLFESPKIDKTALFIYKSSIYVYFECSNNMFYWTSSKDNGATFTRPARLNAKGKGYTKAVYVCDYTQDGHEAVLHDLFTDINNPGEMELLLNIYNDFYSSITQPPNIDNAEETADNSALLEKKVADEIINEKTMEIAVLKNRLESAVKDLDLKDKQILEMNYMASQKKDETAQANIKLRDTVIKLQKELAEKALLEKNLLKEIERYKQEIEESRNTPEPCALNNTGKLKIKMKRRSSGTQNESIISSKLTT